MSNVEQPQDDCTEDFGGRTFARFSLRNNTHCVPIDEEEDERMQELHAIMCGVCEDGVVIAPAAQVQLSEIDTPSVLDCGVGDGAWADDVLEQYENCHVIGVDIFLGDQDRDEHVPAIQEYDKKRWNMNAPFHVEKPRPSLRREQFDLINSRFLADGLSAGRWRPYVQELKEMLKPGGWVQMVELELLFQSDNGLLTDHSPLRLWSDAYRNAMERNGRDPRVGRKLYDLMRRAGFDNISASEYQLRIGAWDRALGSEVRDNAHRTLDTLLLWPLLRGVPPRMTRREYDALVTGAQAQLQDDSLKLYYRLYVVTGQRPTSDMAAAGTSQHS